MHTSNNMSNNYADHQEIRKSLRRLKALPTNALLFIIFASLALATCEISQQKITGDESASSSDSQSTESSLKSSESTTSSPSPYAFSYNTADVAGNQLARQESGDNKGAVRGSYSYRDEDGLFRSVEYIADENGFRAAIRANEPGLGDSNKELLASIYHLTEATPAMVASKAAQPLLASSSKNFHYNCSNSTQTITSTTNTSPTTAPQSVVLASLGPSKVRVSPIKNSLYRLAPVAAARASVRQQRLRPQAISRLVSSQVLSLPSTTPTTTTTTTTTSAEAPRKIAEQISNDCPVQTQDTFTGTRLYAFLYNTADVADNQLARQESGDNKGAVRGSYSYRDADGLFRTVEYIADENGFRAAIRSNEPGLGDSKKSFQQVFISKLELLQQGSPLKGFSFFFVQSQETFTRTKEPEQVTENPIQDNQILIPESIFSQTSYVSTEQPLLVRFLDERFDL
uniref:Uncharacterized protein n=1 Tax=Tetranychus urticae TaxID=32264 RepID=T1KSF0_TETUR